MDPTDQCTINEMAIDAIMERNVFSIATYLGTPRGPSGVEFFKHLEELLQKDASGSN